MRRIPLVLVLAACGNPATVDPQSGSPSALAGGLTVDDLPVRLKQPIVEAAFDQEIDHPYQPGTSLGTFKQRFWTNKDFAANDQAPVIFYLCGEGPCDPWYATSMGDAAKTLGAAIVVLEHRYYGTSYPFPTSQLDKEHMKYLTIHNALEDAAAFQRWAMDNLGLKGKWIAVGGSYPGMLAAFYRLKHPELVAGAWASSAPVRVQMSFMGYDAVVAKAIGPVCTLLAKQVAARAADIFDNPAQLTQTLSALGWDGWMPANKQNWVEEFTWTVAGAAQYGQEKEVCDAMQTYPTNPMQGMIEYMNPPLAADPAPVAATGATGSSGVILAAPHLPFTAHPQPPQMPLIQKPATATNFYRSEWYYQVCTEVGFFQVHNADNNMSVIPSWETEASNMQDCINYVGQTPDIQTTLERYYNPIARGEASNILFVNSSEDPWSTLSFIDVDNAPAGVKAYVVQGGSHCSDLDNLNQGDLLGRFEAHKLFNDLAKQWIAQ